MGLDLWDHREPLKAFKQRGCMLEFRFRWISSNVGAANGLRRDMNKIEEAIRVV